MDITIKMWGAPFLVGGAFCWLAFVLVWLSLILMMLLLSSSSFVLLGVVIGEVRDRIVSGFWWAIMASPKVSVMINISLCRATLWPAVVVGEFASMVIDFSSNLLGF